MAGAGLGELAWEPGAGPALSFTTGLAVTQAFLYLGLSLSSDLLRPHFGKWKPRGTYKIAQVNGPRGSGCLRVLHAAPGAGSSIVCSSCHP